MLKPSPVLKRSVVVNGAKTSISLEQEFFDEAKRIAAHRKMSFGELCAQIENSMEGNNLSSRVRLFVLADVQSRVQTPVPKQENAA